MRRIPALLPVSAFAVALVLAVTGCSSGGSRSTQAEQAMYAAASKPVATSTSLPAGDLWVGGPADGLRMAIPRGWVTVPRRPAPVRCTPSASGGSSRPCCTRSFRAGAAPDR